MLGIEAIGHYIPPGRISNYTRKEQFAIDDFFIEEKIGVRAVSRKMAAEETSDLAVAAFHQLQQQQRCDPATIETLLVVTQNPDYNIPHTSAIVHQKLGLPNSCACFDISLGCSGFVYALSVITAFMNANGFKRGLLLTADPYSKIVDPNDKNTALLFGDAAAATLISDRPLLIPGRFSFGTQGADHEKLICTDGTLYMNGRAVFNFAAKVIPDDIRRMLASNHLDVADLDRLLLHQGSKIIVETIAERLQIPLAKVPYVIHDYGNTISSTIPIMLETELDGPADTIAMSGFGVGLSWASGLLRRAR